VGVPEIVAEAPLVASVTPAGNAPELIDQTNGAVPFAVQVVVYGTFNCSGPEVVVQLMFDAGLMVPL
jgi:hypothetical protein